MLHTQSYMRSAFETLRPIIAMHAHDIQTHPSEIDKVENGVTCGFQQDVKRRRDVGDVSQR